MKQKAKTGIVMGAMAALLSMGSVGGALAASSQQATAVTQTDVKTKVQFKDNAELLALLKIDATKLQEALKSGKTLVEIAKAQNVTKEQLIQLLTKQEEERLAAAVKAGKLTQAEADKLKQKIADRVTKRIENTHQGTGSLFTKNAELLALLKIDATKLQESLDAGKTLAEIAKAQNVTEQQLIQLLTKQEEAELAEAVKSGKLTQERADKKKQTIADRVKKSIENSRQGKAAELADNQELLTLLKMDAAKLQEALKAGKSLSDVAKAQGVSTENVLSLLKKQQQQKIAEAVKAGEITQQKADKRIKGIDAMLKKMLEKKWDKATANK